MFKNLLKNLHATICEITIQLSFKSVKSKFVKAVMINPGAIGGVQNLKLNIKGKCLNQICEIVMQAS